MGIESGKRKVIYNDFEQGQGNRVKDLQRPQLGKPRSGLQIFDTQVDFPVRVQRRGRFLYSPTSDRVFPGFPVEFTMLSFPSCLYLPR